MFWGWVFFFTSQFLRVHFPEKCGAMPSSGRAVNLVKDDEGEVGVAQSDV